MSGRSIPVILGKGWGFPGIGPPPTFDLYSQPWDCLGGPSWTYLVLISLSCPQAVSF